MAIYRAGSLIGAISGSVGGITFVNAKASKVVRFRPIKSTREQRTLPSTGSPARAAFSAAVAGWQALTDEPRQAWISLSREVTFPNRLGEKRSITGYQLYLKVNVLRALKGSAAMTVAPGTTRPQQISDMTITANLVTGIDILVTWPTDQTPKSTLIYGALFFQRRPTAFFRDFRFIAFGFVGKGISEDITSFFEARFGDLRANTAISIRLIPWEDDTYPGTPFQKSIIVSLLP